MRRFFAVLLSLIVFAACVPLRAVRYLIPDSKDSAKFENVRIEKSEAPFQFINNYPNQKFISLKERIDSSLRDTKTAVFLVIKNDSIIYQYLSEGTNLDAKQASFSMSKSFVGTLIGIASDKGLIQSTHDLVIKYLPELEKNDSRFGRLTIQHVLDMRSGFDFNERSFNPFSKITRMYYGADLEKMVGKIKMKREPNTFFEYQSINTQVLAMILERVTGKKLHVLLQEYIWKPIGAESDALWSLDGKDHIKAFCCMNATALDFAKFGRLYLNEGNWEGRQVISKKWVSQTTHPDTLTKYRYKNQIWATRDYRYFNDSISAVNSIAKEGVAYPIERNEAGRYFYARKVYDYKAQGMFHQSIYVNPQNKVIIIRLGGRQKRINFHGFVQEIGRSIKS